MPALAHLGIGLVTKRFFPQIPLWALLIGSMFLDIVAIIFFFSATWITHGLFMGVFWSIISVIATKFIVMRLNTTNEQDKRRKSTKWSIIIGFLVLSHWILDFMGWPMSVIDPNAMGIPLLFDDTVNVGLGGYSTWFGALLMDLGVFLVGLSVYFYYVKKVKNIKLVDETK